MSNTALGSLRNTLLCIGQMASDLAALREENARLTATLKVARGVDRKLQDADEEIEGLRELLKLWLAIDDPALAVQLAEDTSAALAQGEKEG